MTQSNLSRAANGVPPDGQGDAARAEIVPQGDEVGVAAVARHLGVDESTVRRRARELGGVRGERGWTFSLQRVTQRLTLKATRSKDVYDPEFGQRTARVLACLERGERTVQIAIELEEPPAFVLAVREQWVAACHADRSNVVWTCRACAKPSDPQHGYCAACAPHVAVLTEEQRRVLAARDIPTAIYCAACGAVADAGVCSACVEGIVAAVENGVIVVRMGTRVLKEMPLLPLVPPVTTADTSAPVEVAPQASAATQKIVAHAHKVIADARVPIASMQEDK